MSQLQIVRLDPKTGKMETFQLPTPEATWGDAHLTMIDPAHMDVDGQLWFNVAFDTGESGGTWRVDLAKNKWTPITYPKGSPSARAYDVIADSQNNAWGMQMTNDKLWKTDAKTLQTVWYDFPTKGAGCRRGHMDSQERIWCGVFNGNRLAMFDTKTLKFTEWTMPTEWTRPYDAQFDDRAYAWTAGMDNDLARSAECRDRRVHRVPAAARNQRSARRGAEVRSALEPVAGRPARQHADSHRASGPVKSLVIGIALLMLVSWVGAAQTADPQSPRRTSAVAAPADVKPGSINCEDVPYPYPVVYLPLTLYGQDVRMAFMDVPPAGTPNGHTIVLLHGNNFAGFYFGGLIDALRKEGFRVIVPDQIGYGRSSKPIIPYNFSTWRGTRARSCESLNIDKAMIVGHSMGGMLAARFATQYPDVTERLVLYNPIGLVDQRYDTSVGKHGRGLQADARIDLRRPSAPAIMRYVAHNRIRVDAGIRALHAHPLCMDAERRLAATRDGADLDQSGAVCRSGRRRLGTHQSADARVRRRGRQPARFASAVPGTDEVCHRHDPQRQRATPPASRARPCSAHGSTRQNISAARGVPERRRPLTARHVMRPPLTRRRFLEQLGAVGGSSLVMTAMSSWDLMAGQAGVRPALSGRPSKANVLVLGAGVSGLVVGYELSKLGYDFRILEARDRVGGLNWTVRAGH